MLIEEGFSSRGCDAGETETSLIGKAVDYFAFNAVRNEAS
jgi:hypothetical protein